MNKVELKNDMKFREVCINFATDFWNDDFEIYGNVIKLNSLKKGVYTLIDEHYNVIGVYTDELSLEHQTKEELANKIAEIYIKHSEFNETSTNILPARFEEFSLKEIQDLSKRISIMPSNHGHSTDMIINWQKVRRTDDDFSKLCFYYLTYIKFLGCYIERYFNELFRMKSLGINYPDIYTYLSKIISGIEKCIENVKDFSVRNIGDYIGEPRVDFLDNYSNMVYQIINFYCFDYSKVNIANLDDNMNNILSRILEEPDEVVEERYENMKKFIHPGYIELLDLVQPISNYSLKKKINNKHDLS